MKDEKQLMTTLETKEADRLAFVVYRKAMVYISAMIALSAAVLGFWGYKDWSNLKTKIKQMEKKVTKADSTLTLSLSNIQRLEKERDKLMKDWEDNLKYLGRLEMLEETLKETSRKQLAENRNKIGSAIAETEEKFIVEQKKLLEGHNNLFLQINELGDLKTELQAYLDSLRRSGSTLIVLQSNQITQLNSFGINIKLGNIKDAFVENIDIFIEETGKRLGIATLKMDQEYAFILKKKDAQGAKTGWRYYLKPTTRLRQPIVHDLLIAQLRWEPFSFKD